MNGRDEPAIIAQAVLQHQADQTLDALLRAGAVSAAHVAALAWAVLHHCLADLPIPTAIVSSGPADRTMPVSGGVLGVIDDPSDGICEPSQDGPTAAAVVGHTAMYRDDRGNGYAVKLGGAERVAIPNAVPILSDCTRR